MESQHVQPLSFSHPSHSRGDTGVSLPKTLVAIAIIAILIGSSLPAYQIYQQRAYASEASVMLTQILDSQRRHFRQYDKFYPSDGQPISIFHGDPSSWSELQVLENALGINIPEDDLFDYYIRTFPSTTDEFCVVMVSAPFPLFLDGTFQLIGLLDNDGRLLVSSELALH
jgi:type II secretory pathway pseudopilin PulG